MGVEARRHEHQLGLEACDGRRRRSRRTRAGTPRRPSRPTSGMFSGRLALLVRAAAARVERPLVKRDEEDGVVVPEDLLRSVAVVDVPVDDRDALDQLGLRGPRRDRDVVEEAEAHRRDAAARGGRADGRARSRRARRLDRSAGREQRGLVVVSLTIVSASSQLMPSIASTRSHVHACGSEAPRPRSQASLRPGRERVEQRRQPLRRLGMADVGCRRASAGCVRTSIGERLPRARRAVDSLRAPDQVAEERRVRSLSTHVRGDAREVEATEPFIHSLDPMQPARRSCRPARSFPAVSRRRTPPPSWGSGRRGEGEGRRRPASRFAGRAAVPPPAPRTGPPRALASSVPYCAQQIRRRLRADATRARKLVRRVAAQRDEVGHLRRLDAVALAHLRRPDPRELADAARRLQDRRVLARELERVPVGGGDERRAAALLLARDRSARGSRRPRSPAPSRRRSRARATSSGSRSSCSSSSSSNSRPPW